MARAGDPSTSLLIVAGGRGTRLSGQRKALLEVGGRPIIRRLLEALAPLADEVLVLDAEPHAGVLTATAQGLVAASGEVCLVTASDMPFVSRVVFEHLLAVQRRLAADMVVPRIGGVLQPMHMVVRQAPALGAVRTALASGERRLFRALLALRPLAIEADDLRAVDPNLRTFFTINTPDDLVEARRMAYEQAAASSGSSCPGAEGAA